LITNNDTSKRAISVLKGEEEEGHCYMNSLRAFIHLLYPLSKPHLGALNTDVGPSHQAPSFEPEDELPDDNDSMDNTSFSP
jgi:hypothetical protein